MAATNLSNCVLQHTRPIEVMSFTPTSAGAIAVHDWVSFDSNGGLVTNPSTGAGIVAGIALDASPAGSTEPVRVIVSGIVRILLNQGTATATDVGDKMYAKGDDVVPSATTPTNGYYVGRCLTKLTSTVAGTAGTTADVVLGTVLFNN